MIEITEDDRRMYGDLANRLAAAYASFHVGHKAIDYTYKQFVDGRAPDGWVRLAKWISQEIAEKWGNDWTNWDGPKMIQ